MAKYCITVIWSDEVIGQADTDDRSMRIAPTMSGPGRQAADEIDIQHFTLSNSGLQKLGDPPLLFEVLTKAPFRFEITDEGGALGKQGCDACAVLRGSERRCSPV